MMFVIFLSALLFSSGINAYKILVIYPTQAYSHQRGILALTETLVRQGHELFVVSPFEVPGLVNFGNYTFVDISYRVRYETLDKIMKNTQRQRTLWELNRTFSLSADATVRQFLSKPFTKFKKLVDSKKLKFDVAIVEEWIMPFTYTMARLLDEAVPIVSMSSLNTANAEHYLGSISSAHASLFTFGTDKMDLKERIQNWISYLYGSYTQESVFGNTARRFFRETYGSEIESLVDRCWTDISLLMLTSNPLYFYPRALGPNIVQVGPLHLRPPSELPKILKDWLDGAEKGVIYFSLGSFFKTTYLSDDARNNFLRFFKELPSGYRVLWKWEEDGQIPGQSDNILTQKWMPQDSVLAHPNLKVFITRGGLQSFHEAVHYGVPTIGIPYFWDQRTNIAKMVDAKIGVQLLLEELHEYGKVELALKTVLYDESYAHNMRRYSAISRDFSSQALNKAVFWVEHVAKHGGAQHLRPATADTNLFQFFCLDIISVILVFSFALLFAIYSIFMFGASMIFGRLKLKEKKV
nr:PREDICTED: UDP-glucuronosyltransferase 2B18-like [Bemisia tabaci]